MDKKILNILLQRQKEFRESIALKFHKYFVKNIFPEYIRPNNANKQDTQRLLLDSLTPLLNALENDEALREFVFSKDFSFDKILKKKRFWVEAKKGVSESPINKHSDRVAEQFYYQLANEQEKETYKFLSKHSLIHPINGVHFLNCNSCEAWTVTSADPKNDKFRCPCGKTISTGDKIFFFDEGIYKNLDTKGKLIELFLFRKINGLSIVKERTLDVWLNPRFAANELRLKLIPHVFNNSYEIDLYIKDSYLNKELIILSGVNPQAQNEKEQSFRASGFCNTFFVSTDSNINHSFLPESNKFTNIHKQESIDRLIQSIESYFK